MTVSPDVIYSGSGNQGGTLPRDAKLVSVAIAGPSDVDVDLRTVIESVGAWNARHSEHEGVSFVPKHWKTHVMPELGSRAQTLINRSVIQESDALIACFFHRMGTPTGASESGSAEEIELTVSSGKPALVYFCNKPVPQSKLDIGQFQRLQAFKQLCFNNGVCFEYSSASILRRNLLDHLTALARRFASPPNNRMRMEDKVPSLPTATGANDATDDVDYDNGYLDYLADVQSSLEPMTTAVQQIADATTAVGLFTAEQTPILYAAIAQGNFIRVQSVCNVVANRLGEYADSLHTSGAEFQQASAKLLSGLFGFVSMQFPVSERDLSEWHTFGEVLSSLFQTTNDAYTKLEGLRDGIAAMEEQRASRSLRKSAKRASVEVGAVLSVLRACSESALECAGMVREKLEKFEATTV